jgi:hypothetical protein
MKSDEVGTTIKHPETINGNVKNLSKRIGNILPFLSWTLEHFKLIFFFFIKIFMYKRILEKNRAHPYKL